MTIRTILYNLRKAASFSGTLSEKISIFFTLSRLHIKRNVFSSSNVKVSEHFLNYKFWGFDYWIITYLFKEIFITNDYYFKSDKNDPIIIDCGANIGMSVLYFKRLFPNSRIIAFEPNPNAFNLLEENIKENQLENVQLHNLALFDKETEISFFIDDSDATLKGSVQKGRGGSRELKVKAQKLSLFLKDIDSVDLIKMDVEGAEVNIISDLVDSSCINKSKEYIIEYHHNINNGKSNLASFLNYFETNGFNYKIKASYSQMYVFQDLLIHFYK